MITRIVKLPIDLKHIEAFENVFNERKQRILSQKGCTALKLLKEGSTNKEGQIYFTYSEWNSEVELNQYRSSDFFAETWKLTKKCFYNKAKAWTTYQLS